MITVAIDHMTCQCVHGVGTLWRLGGEGLLGSAAAALPHGL